MSTPTITKASTLPVFLLSAAGFTVLTTEFVIVGLLPSMAQDLHVSLPQAGMLVSLFAFTVALFGPPLTAWLSRFERKRMFVATLVFFALSNLLSALAPNIWVMAIARFFPALMLPVYWSLASETVIEIAGPKNAGKAISAVSLGPVLATVFGIPLGKLIGNEYGWRTAFATLAVLALLKAVMLFFCLPQVRLVAQHARFFRQFTILRDPKVLGNVLLSLLLFTGMFTAYTYLAAILEKLGNFSGSTVGWMLMGFGAFGLIGNWLGGRMVERHPFGSTHVFSITMGIATLALTPSLPTFPLLAIVLAVWGICQSALFPICHVRVMKTATAFPALGASLNISGANIGIGLGSYLGGRVIHVQGLSSIGGAATGVILIAVGLTYILQLTSKRCKA